jgi:hypothetical protein
MTYDVMATIRSIMDGATDWHDTDALC